MSRLPGNFTYVHSVSSVPRGDRAHGDLASVPGPVHVRAPEGRLGADGARGEHLGEGDYGEQGEAPRVAHWAGNLPNNRAVGKPKLRSPPGPYGSQRRPSLAFMHGSSDRRRKEQGLGTLVPRRDAPAPPPPRSRPARSPAAAPPARWRAPGAGAGSSGRRPRSWPRIRSGRSGTPSS